MKTPKMIGCNVRGTRGGMSSKPSTRKLSLYAASRMLKENAGRFLADRGMTQQPSAFERTAAR